MGNSGLSGLSGLAAAVTALGTVFRMSQKTVRSITGDDAQMRIILNGHATEVAHLRAIDITNLEEALSVNRQRRQARIDAVSQIERYLEPLPESTVGGPVAQAGTANSFPLDSGRAILLT